MTDRQHTQHRSVEVGLILFYLVGPSACSRGPPVVSSRFDGHFVSGRRVAERRSHADNSFQFHWRRGLVGRAGGRDEHRTGDSGPHQPLLQTSQNTIIHLQKEALVSFYLRYRNFRRQIAAQGIESDFSKRSPSLMPLTSRRQAAKAQTRAVLGLATMR